ncbi:hypothetical protein F0562_011526 [Nyssa sinensis]|uniref:POX domain-containing protein n=1 Tax=Nyssa sinensis TaxID=561372 RepID=A0A5J4ZPP0_9ASTE|nr:hypothetical protein F0562_011526 [Nyssa sinensis]
MARPSGEERPRNMVSSLGYCFPDVESNNPHIQTHLVNQLQSFESNPEIYNLTTGMEMIGFPPKNLQQQSDNNSAMWKGFFGKSAGNLQPAGPSSSKTINESTSDFYQHEFNTGGGVSDTTSETLMVASDPTSWHDQNRLLVDDSSLSSRDGFVGKSMNIQQQQHIMQDEFLGKAAINLHHPGHLQIRNSKFLGPARELLNEFCNLGTKQTDPPKIKPQKTTQWQDENASSSSSKKQSLHALELLELQKRKTKLLSMLEEVDRRYRHYCDQMKAVVSSFEVVAGNGAAMVYSALASKAMSRHFRCLRDGIVSQIKATKKAMGEKDAVAPGDDAR